MDLWKKKKHVLHLEVVEVLAKNYFYLLGSHITHDCRLAVHVHVQHEDSVIQLDI